MDLLRKAKRLEAGIARVLDGATRNAMKSAALEPLEIAHAVVEKVAAEVQPVGRGKHVFPFNRIRLSVVAPSLEARARLAAVFESEPSLQARIVDRLRASGCDAVDLDVKVVYVSAAQTEWSQPQWHMEVARIASTVSVDVRALDESVQPAIELTIVKGSGTPESSTFSQRRIELGRCAEVRDGRNRLIRTNHVSFSDAAGQINESVSRCHAHIDFVQDSRDYRVHDDRSAHGTGVVRDGRAMVVPSGARGLRLRSGDEILLGDARVKVRILDSAL
jgi:hypothetical protein